MKSEPFLWIHLAGLVAFPLFLQVAWVGLAIGDPLPFVWPEWLALATLAAVPIFWMQWSRPFDIFSLLVVALEPERLTPEQRKILSLFKRPRHRPIVLLGTGLFLATLWPLYRFAPLAAPVAAHFPSWRPLGLAIAGLALLLSHLFLQVPLGVLGVLLTGEGVWRESEPVAAERVPELFTLFGLKVDRLLPPLITDTGAPNESNPPSPR